MHIHHHRPARVILPGLLSALTLAGLTVGSGAAHAETVTIPIPKAEVSTALNDALADIKVYVDTYAGRLTGNSSYHEDHSYIGLADGHNETMLLPESRFYVLPTRLWLHNIDDMGSQAINSHIDGDRLVVEIAFESQGPEIIGECLNRNVVTKSWWSCIDIERDIDLDNTRITVAADVIAYNGSISYANPDVTMTTDLRIRNKACVGPLCDLIERNIRRPLVETVEQTLEQGLANDGVGEHVAKAMRAALPAYLKDGWNVTNVAGQGSNYLLTVERPDQIGADSVTSLTLAPVAGTISAACPTTAKFAATVEAKHNVDGVGWLADGSGGRVSDFTWSASKGRTITSTVTRSVTGQPGTTTAVQTVLTLSWKGSDGKTYTRASNVATVDLTCSWGPGGIVAP